ncbi:hypothetical protein ACFFGF_06410 [Asaia lannensis]|uniref:Uncharacterized protein n=1 Tax=Asaia lannensis NBRC 102526 TaxID=1307926 RepID=A0ABT1CG20_9PROT|nr:hypothetical protein [Asaia lannensis]MCO6159814.1 hypothetical protein [Asaia lannensis NBRC 102526]
MDGRIPLLIVDDRTGIDDAVMHRRGEGALLDMREDGGEEGWLVHRRLASEAAALWKHDRFCACCVGQQPVQAALTQLFLDRVRGVCPHFSFAVLFCVSCSAHALRELLQQEVLVSARYRI